MTTVSVVMGTYNDAAVLLETLHSVLAQGLADFEFIIINDGSTDPQVAGILQEYSHGDSRIRVLNKRNEGLTRALIDGCAMARGAYIARIDAGDVMLPGRLVAQVSILQQHPECAFVSCWTQFCGPDWEPLWLAKGQPSATQPCSLLPNNPEQGLLGDIPHHGSVMFRRSSYEEAGGYRAEFYYGQDWDLWYRLAEIGSYQVAQKALYCARLFTQSISMKNSRDQTKIARCSLGGFQSRLKGESDRVWLRLAAEIRPDSKVAPMNSHAENPEPGLYFIGEALRRRGDSRCRPYLAKAIENSPFKPRAYVRLLQSLFPVRPREPESDTDQNQNP